MTKRTGAALSKYYKKHSTARYTPTRKEIKEACQRIREFNEHTPEETPKQWTPPVVSLAEIKVEEESNA